MSERNQARMQVKPMYSGGFLGSWAESPEACCAPWYICERVA